MEHLINRAATRRLVVFEASIFNSQLLALSA